MSATLYECLFRNRNRERVAHNMSIAPINAILISLLFIRFSNSHYINTTNTYHSLLERYTTNVTTSHKHHQPQPPLTILSSFSVHYYSPSPKHIAQAARTLIF